jgi:hypothetical protein
VVKSKRIMILVAAWVIAIGYGFHSLLAYKGRPGSTGKIPEVWPRNTLITRSTDKPHLVMFAHPRCPCTRASLGELELLVARAKDKAAVTVVFYQPEGAAEDWLETDSIRLARSIYGVQIAIDREGQLATRFGVETSGHTLLYASNGQLLFSGGITGSRGHLGDNEGFDSVLKSVRNDSTTSSPHASSKVFGCGLFDRCTSSQTADKK